MEFEKDVQEKYWWALRYAIENFNEAVEKNENKKLMRCLESVINLRITELDRAEGK